MWVGELDKDGIKSEIPWRKVINEFTADYNMWDLSRFTQSFWLEWYSITNHGSLIYIKTNLNAPRYKVITIDISTNELETRDFIPELKDGTLSQVKCVNKEYFIVIYKRNVIVSLAFYLFLNSPNVDISPTGQWWNIPLLEGRRSTHTSGARLCWRYIHSKQRETTSFLPHLFRI